MERTYLCIDLKSFYASVECIERGLDPLTTNLVVADHSRTDKTICLAVSPSLKAQGIPGRPRLFEVVQKVKEVNCRRKEKTPHKAFVGASYDKIALDTQPELELSYIVAPPRMAHYMEYSARIYRVYLNYVAPEDIHVYSIDEVFMDITDYLHTYKRTAHALAMDMIHDVLKVTGITATAGIGTNLYLAKIAMDILAKKMPADKDGVRIAELDELLYRKLLWSHRPLTDFWQLGKGYAAKLEKHRLYTMGDIAELSLSTYGEDKLYQLFGINAELLIDHAWGWEPCTMADIRSYRPKDTSMGSGQVLQKPYSFEKAKLITREMTELLVLDLVEKHFVTDQIVLTIGYDVENLTNPAISRQYTGEIVKDPYGRMVPKHAHGTANVGRFTASTRLIMEAVMALYDRIVHPNLLVRRVHIRANHVINEAEIKANERVQQLNLFTDYATLCREEKQEKERLDKERAIQETTIRLRNRFGKNAVLKGTSLQEGATTIERNRQIGGHKA
ncbi:MAG: DNA methylase [Clostridia bacterium]|nr:DNA methylase [Clostridia bacterium]